MSTPSKPVLSFALLVITFTVVIGQAEPQPSDKPAAQVAALTNDTITLTNASGTLTIRGLYAHRSPPRNDSSGERIGTAAIRGLRWLQQTQNADGSWGAGADDLEASTGLAVLAFLGHGDTAASPEFGTEVRKGVEFLVAGMYATNRPASPSPAFGHAIATWALCESYSMMRTVVLQSPCESGLATILKGQRRSGLWDVSYRTTDGVDDIEVSVLQVLALKSGLMMGAEEKPLRDGLRKASEAMKYALDAKPDVGATAGMVLCLQLCGEGRSSACKSGLATLATMTPDWEAPVFHDPVFRWFLANQAFFLDGGQHWMRWNRLFMPMLAEHQIGLGDDTSKGGGYWDSPGSGEPFGRVGATALCVMMFGNGSIRHLPLYSPPPQTNVSAADGEEIRIEVK